MLLKQRPPQIDTTRPFEPNPGFEHVDAGEIALLRWLKEHRIDFVLVGSVFEALHTDSVTAGPLAIVPAPYRRNLERLARALAGAEARVRNEWALPPDRAQDAVAELTVAELMRDQVWSLCCGPLPIDVVGTAAPSASGGPGTSGYQELLYESTRSDLTADLSVEIASPEDIEHYAHLRRTGIPPQITISRRESDGDSKRDEMSPERNETSPERDEAPPERDETPPTSQTHRGGNGRAPTGAPHPDSPPGSG
jgi:hypothetical protein